MTELSHPYVGSWWPPGHGLGYEHGFTHRVVDLVTAVGRSSATGSWQSTAVPAADTADHCLERTSR